DKINSHDFEVVINAEGQSGEWVATVKKNNLSALNPEINISQGVSRVKTKNFIVKLTQLVSEQIPIIVAKPIGEAPKGYVYLDTWPYRLYTTIEGPKDTVAKLKKQGLKLTFNLNDISKADLNTLEVSSKVGQGDVVSYFVPNHWKEILIPELSDTPIQINDPISKYLRIDFVRVNLLPITTPTPVDLFFLPKTASSLNPLKTKLGTNETVKLQNGIKVFDKPLFTKGVSKLFLDTVQDYLEIVVITTPVQEGQSMQWTTQFIDARNLENHYVDILMSDVSNQELSDLHPQVREEYLRNRFRSYMNRFALFDEEGKPLKLFITKKNNQIIITEENENSTP
ncbi:MAG: hypothetical protein KDK44_06070, partial [Chlamydiia bacterium]|nr:hypothetical protein [Chlamydiia bacterium]